MSVELNSVPLTKHGSVNRYSCNDSNFFFTSTYRFFSVSQCSYSASAPSTSPSSPNRSAFSALVFIFASRSFSASASALVAALAIASSRSAFARTAPRSMRRSHSRIILSNTALVSRS